MFSYQFLRMIGFDYTGLDTQVRLIYHALGSLLNHACTLTHTHTHTHIINAAVQGLSLSGMTTGCMSTTGYCSARKRNRSQATYSGQKREVCSWSRCLQAYISESQWPKRTSLTTWNSYVGIDMVGPPKHARKSASIQLPLVPHFSSPQLAGLKGTGSVAHRYLKKVNLWWLNLPVWMAVTPWNPVELPWSWWSYHGVVPKLRTQGDRGAVTAPLWKGPCFRPPGIRRPHSRQRNSLMRRAFPEKATTIIPINHNHHSLR